MFSPIHLAPLLVLAGLVHQSEPVARTPLTAHTPPPTAVPDDMTRRLVEGVEKHTASGLAGVLLIDEGEGITHLKGYGNAVRDPASPFTEATVTSLGSITKLFTSAAILELEADGVLSRTDTLDAWLDDVPADKSAITLEHLLTHTSGLPRDDESLLPGIRGDNDPMPKGEMIRAAFALELATPPGERFAYSNLGYSLLAAVIEAATEQAYEEVLQERLFHPAEIFETGYRRPHWHPSRLAHGYSGDHHFGTVAGRGWLEDGPGWSLRGNGGIHSTVLDLYRWTHAVTGDRIFGEAERADYFEPRIESDIGPMTYGGVAILSENGPTTIFFGGGNGFFATGFFFQPETGLTVIFATNEEDRAGDLYMELFQILGLG